MRKAKLLFGAAGLLFLVACSDAAVITPPVTVTPPPPPPPPPPVTVSYQVTVSNLTNAQPLSPTAFVAHTSALTLFSAGESVSVDFENLAEGGDAAPLIASLDGNANVRATAIAEAPTGPGMSQATTVTFNESDLMGTQLSLATMLVNTNDAITGLNNFPIYGLEVGDVRTMRARAYDSGTEADTELAGTIPGPAGGGEGFNAARDDSVDAVTVHTGVVTRDDGLITSALNNQHKFDNPVIQIRIERTE